MASGRIQPGSRQWVEAMRRLSGTEDTTVDMSMGRKVSRDAAIPHGMGTAALDTRLRGEGEPGELAFEMLTSDLSGEVTFRVSGGARPYRFQTDDVDIMLQEAGDFTHTYEGLLQRTASITDADDDMVEIDVYFLVPLPQTWVPVTVALLEQAPARNGPMEMNCFDFFNRSEPGAQFARGLGVGGWSTLGDENGKIFGASFGSGISLPLTFGQRQRIIQYHNETGVSYGWDFTSPAMIPGEMQPASLLEFVDMDGNDPHLRMPTTNGGHPNWPTLTVLNTVYGPMGQADLWPEGKGLLVSRDPFGAISNDAHWDGTAWAAGRAPAPPPPPPVDPFEFANGIIHQRGVLRNGWVALRGGRFPFTTDAPPEWNVMVPANSGPSWNNALIPDGPQTMTITDADGSEVRVTFDYTDLEDNEQRQVQPVVPDEEQDP